MQSPVLRSRTLMFAALAFPMALATVAISAPSVTYAATPTITSPASIDSEEWAFLPLINEFRAQQGAAPLKMSQTLTTAAEWMSTDMATKNYFSHTDSHGRNFATRLTSFGYTGTMGENIAAGQKSAQDVFEAWKNSPGHRTNMLNPNYTVIGVARVTAKNAHYSTYWTTDFGATVDQVITPQPGTTQPTIQPTPQTPVIQRHKKVNFRRLWLRLGRS